MEIKDSSPIWLDENHPNFLRWQRARELSVERGRFVQSILNNYIKANDLKILDLGSGEGGTSKIFSENNFVISFELNLIRLQRQKDSSDSHIGMTEMKFINGNALQLPFHNQYFDLIIIQDVIEHLNDVKRFYEEIKRVLKQNGIIYLSTPNKFSVFNFISDPHFGLPIVSVLNRKTIKKFFLRFLRKKDFKRTDIAQLFSISDLTFLFQNDFQITLNTKFTVDELFKGNKGIVWSDFHLSLIKLSRKLKLNSIIIKTANDNVGILNKFFTPTFYIVLIRKL